MLQGWRHKVVTILLYHDCIGLVGTTFNKSDNINKVVTRLLTACSKLVDNLGQAVRRQLVDSLFADLLQDARLQDACVLHKFALVHVTQSWKWFKQEHIFVKNDSCLNSRHPQTNNWFHPGVQDVVLCTLKNLFNSFISYLSFRVNFSVVHGLLTA
jgi:hypothetical protein